MLQGYYETIVKHRKTPKENLVGFGFFLLGIAGAVAAFILGVLLGLRYIGFAGAFFAFFFGVRAAVNHSWEYEYIVTEGTVDIDQVIARQKRKRMVSFDCRECEIIAPYSRGNRFEAYKTLPIRFFTARDDHPDNYFAVFERVGAKNVVVFQPTEAMVDAFKHYNHRNVFTD